MDLRSWVLADHSTSLQRLERQVLERVPPERWPERVDGGGNSIGWGVLHAWYHQDVAVSVARGAEVEGTADAVDPTALVSYARDVHARTAEWFAGLELGVLDTVANASRGLSELAGIGRDDADTRFCLLETKRWAG